MKFATGLVLAAITVNTVHAGNPSMQIEVPSESASDSASSSGESQGFGGSCNFGCLAVMRPVTDENGVTYSNECVMRAAKCRKGKGNKKEENVLEEYKRLYGKSFGASRDEDAGDDSASEESGSSSGAINIVQGTKSASSDSGEEESASGDSKPKSYCPNILCPAVYQPVTDENGVMYSNKCAMEAAKCKGPRENVLDEYKRIYGKEFGAPRSGDESASEEDDSASDESEPTKMVKGTKGSGKAEKSMKATKTSSDSDSGIGSLYEDGSEGVIDDGTSPTSKKCADACPDVMMPVCGSDGVKYANPCELKLAACQNPDQNIVEDDSACTSSKVASGQETIVANSRKIGTAQIILGKFSSFGYAV